MSGREGSQPDLELRAAAFLDLGSRALEMVLSGTGDGAVFEVIARAVEAIAPSIRCGILLVDPPGRLASVAGPSLPAEYVAAINGLPIAPDSGSCGAAAFRGEIVIVPDIEADRLWAPYRDLVRQYGIEACASVPFKDGSGKVLGVLSLYYPRQDSLGPIQLKMAENAARLSSVVVVCKRAAEALRESEARHSLVMQATGSGVWAWDAHTGEIYVSPRSRELVGLPKDVPADETLAFARVHPDDEARMRVAYRKHLGSREPFDIELRLRHKDESYHWYRLTGQASWDESGQPLNMAGSMTDITASKLAEQALRDSEERLRSLSRQLLDAQEAEKRTIARDLHDEVGQNLSALKTMLVELQHPRGDDARRALLDTSLRTTDQLLSQIRNLALDLRPAILDDLGLTAAVEWCLERATLNTGIRTAFDADPSLPPVDPTVATACFRILQEATTNCVRHARARRFTVALQTVNGQLELTCADDGVGFDAAAALENALHGHSLGLLTMRERAELLGGDVMIRSDGSGTVVRARLPLAPTSSSPSRSESE